LMRTDTASAGSLYACGKKPDRWAEEGLNQQQAPQLNVPASAGCASAPRLQPVRSRPPKWMPIVKLRSLRTSHGFQRSHRGKYPGGWFAGRTPAALSALRRRKVLQLFITLPAIHRVLALGAEPKTSASLADF
jgi:hypothetical protein